MKLTFSGSCLFVLSVWWFFVDLVSQVNGQIPDTPDYLCIQKANDSDVDQVYEYRYNATTNERRYEGRTENDFNIAVVDNVWVIYDDDLVLSEPPSATNSYGVVAYCSTMPSDYTPSTSDMGNPSDCQAWTEAKLEVTDDTLNCASFDEELSWLDWIFLGYAILVTIVLSCYMIPHCPKNDKCQKSYYPAAHLDTYSEILKLRGMDPKAKKSENDKRTVDVAFLKHDLVHDKVNWHNDWWKDYYLYLRFEHPVISLCYGHNLHPYSRKERWITFIGVQFVAMGLASYITVMIAEMQTTVLWGFFWGFVIDILYGCIVTCFEELFEKTATCEGAETMNRSQRRSKKRSGHCYMLCLFVTAIFCGITWLSYNIEEVNDVYPGVNMSAVMLVFLVNYITGLVIAWFALDLSFDTIAFTNEWHRQRGEAPTCCTKCCGVSCYCHKWCCLSWTFCMGTCWYYYCSKRYQQPNWQNYRKDGSGNVIGTEDGLFAVTYHDFESLNNKIPLSPRDLNEFINQIGFESPKVMSNVATNESDLENGLTLNVAGGNAPPGSMGIASASATPQQHVAT